MASLNSKLDDFINFVKNEGSATYPAPTHNASINSRSVASPKRSPAASRRHKSPLRLNFDPSVESRLNKVEEALQTMSRNVELQTNIVSIDQGRKDDLQNLAAEIDTALKNLETRLLTTIRSNIEAQRFEYTSRIEESSRLVHEKITEVQSTVNKQDLQNQRQKILEHSQITQNGALNVQKMETALNDWLAKVED